MAPRSTSLEIASVFGLFRFFNYEGKNVPINSRSLHFSGLSVVLVVSTCWVLMQGQSVTKVNELIPHLATSRANFPTVTITAAPFHKGDFPWKLGEKTKLH